MLYWRGILIAYADRRPDKVFTLQGNKARQKAKRPHMRAFRNTSWREDYSSSSRSGTISIST
ncbi:TPA: hypothetical protein GFX87_02060 [Escherichia coli]|nr:hypothetical protein [Escherichia coli]